MEGETKSKILIVDDEKANLMYLNDLLGSASTLHMAKDGAQALRHAAEFAPDLILLDIVMPGMSGYEVLSELKKSEKTRNIPVIFITGLDTDEDETKGLELGADDYISKPFNEAIVRLRIKNQLKIVNQMRLIIEKEIAEKSSRAKSEFLSRMSHELRTPLNAIIGMTALAQNADDISAKDNFLNKSAAASQDLLKLVEDVLDISDLSDGNFLLANDEFYFAGLMQNELERAKRSTEGKRQTLICEMDPTIPETLVGDGKRLAQVIGNLLSNAGKFTPEHGTIQVSAQYAAFDNERATLRIDVRDNGVGIPWDKRELIFSAFEQADGGSARKFGGAGTGLHLSKIIVEKMDGKIWLESEPGKGSVFSFTFKARIRLPNAEAETPATFAGNTMLLADDVEINREIIMALFEDTQMQFECAENGIEAVELFKTAPAKYDIVLMDINMPGMDGVEATRHIRSLGASEGRVVPIIAVTANTSPEDVAGYLSAGMTDCLVKPLDFEKIMRLVSRYVANNSEADNVA
ncbi:MAG: response regulator [Defluviitaleaceae bacterium]|nr:response regulator [Defluviitaleaceae bacterium]